MNHYPMTEDQRQAMDLGLATIMETLRDISSVLRACYDDQDAPVWRVEEARAAMQRLIWAMERQEPGQTPETCAAGVPEAVSVAAFPHHRAIQYLRTR
jgi:hypothetical protein